AGATFMEATPVTWRLLLDAGWEGSEGLQMLSSGEALTEDLAERLLSRGARLWNGYGASEGGIMTTMHEVRPGERPVRIGRPIARSRSGDSGWSSGRSRRTSSSTPMSRRPSWWLAKTIPVTGAS